MTSYRVGDKYITKKGRTYFFITSPGNPETSFFSAIQTYANALINSSGGIIVFGVNGKEVIHGFNWSRQLEDEYKCLFDRAIRNFKPTVHPHQYRMDVLYLNYGKAILEIRIAPGNISEIYENCRKEMFIVKEKKLYGPLIPCEIVQIVLEKYKEEIAGLIVNKQSKNPPVTEAETSDKAVTETQKNEENRPTEHKPKRIRITR